MPVDGVQGPAAEYKARQADLAPVDGRFSSDWTPLVAATKTHRYFQEVFGKVISSGPNPNGRKQLAIQEVQPVRQVEYGDGIERWGFQFYVHPVPASTWAVEDKCNIAVVFGSTPSGDLHMQLTPDCAAAEESEFSIRLKAYVNAIDGDHQLWAVNFNPWSRLSGEAGMTLEKLEAFYRAGEVLKDAVFGVEQEYGVVCKMGRHISSDKATDGFVMRIENTFGGHQFFHRDNCGRTYMDVGNHPESATPECNDPREVAIYDEWGSRNWKSIAEASDKRSAALPRKTSIFKANVAALTLMPEDLPRDMFGTHDNVLGRQIPWDRFAWTVVSLRSSLAVVVGSGCLDRTSDGDTSFFLSPRSQRVTEVAHLQSVNANRPIVKLFKEDTNEWCAGMRRYEFTDGSASRNAFGTYFRIGFTALALRMAERNPAALKHLAVLDAMKAHKVISADPTLQAKVELVDHKRATGLEIMRGYWEAAADHVEQEPSADWEPAFLANADRVLKLLEANDPSAGKYVDWVLKHWVLSAMKDRYGCDWDDPRIIQADAQYHAVGEDTMFQKLFNSGHVQPFFSRLDLDHVATHPPQTRAATRLEVLNALENRASLGTHSWGYVNVTRPRTDVAVGRIEMLDPRYRNLELEQSIREESPNSVMGKFKARFKSS